jgi:hypothetical protein
MRQLIGVAALSATRCEHGGSCTEYGRARQRQHPTTMKHAKLVVALIGGRFGTYAGAQSLSGGLGLVVYPSAGQDSTQQARDEGESVRERVGRKYTVK